MRFWGSKEYVHTETAKVAAIVMGSIITMISIIAYTVVTVTCIETKYCFQAGLGV